MKYISVLLGGLLLVAASAGAQANFGNSVSLAAPSFMTYAVAPAAPAPNLELNTPSAFSPAVFASPATALPAAMPQDVQGLFEKYSLDLYAGYTFFRFYEVPGTISNM